ncbi:MAG TPA: DUF5107 domain-containing protein [Acidimicrobiia bacterium]|nr:DUF5107 domain-containing protein [Acidimicrobiia bacterium]
MAVIVAVALVVAACGRSPSAGPSSTAAPSTVPTTTAVATTTAPDPDGEPPVLLRRSQVTWETYAFELSPFNTIVPGSYDGVTRTTHTFDTWILENEHLEVTLVPEYGGRILSIVSKSTGHEQLYRNPLGVPYQIDTGVFYFNWLMVYGGIFPTFPEPEHGKTWFLPWDFEVLEESDDAVTVAMSFVDDKLYPFVPKQYRSRASGLEVTFTITLRAGRAALDTSVVIRNPTDDVVSFEYWTNATLAPGSDPADPKVTRDAEIVAPVDSITIPAFWSEIAAVEQQAGADDVYRFDRLRRFENWVDRGIAYAWPDMRGTTFWGVVDQGTGEGIFRIGDGSVTPGLKIWTWGHPQTDGLDPFAAPNEARPYIELWAGLTREFFERTEIGPGREIRIDAVYAPTVGLSAVTHATEDVLVDLRADDGAVHATVFGLMPGAEMSAVLTADGVVVAEEELVVDAVAAGEIVSSTLAAAPGEIRLVLRDASGGVVLDGRLDLESGS